MPEPAMRIPAENVGFATRAALKLADERGLTSLAVPGMGTGVGRVAPEDAAAMMINAILDFTPRALQSITLVDIDPGMVEAWRTVLSRHRT